MFLPLSLSLSLSLLDSRKKKRITEQYVSSRGEITQIAGTKRNEMVRIRETEQKLQKLCSRGGSGRKERERERMIERSAKELVRDGSRDKLNNFGFDVFLGETGKGFRSL